MVCLNNAHRNKLKFFDKNHGLTLLKNSIFRTFCKLPFFWSNICSFSFLNQNQGLTPWKNDKFSIFKTFCFYPLERHFFVLQYRKRHFPGLYCLKKKLEKWPFLDQNHGLTPLKKCQFFDFLNILFL